MEYTIENQYLRVTVTTLGAQVKSAVRKSDGVEHIWQADPVVWGCHAPILFPYTGRLKNGILEVKGKQYESAAPHGFARMMEHSLVRQSGEELELELMDTPESLAVWPYRFRLSSCFRLEGDALHHTLRVENRDQEDMLFGIGFHPAFAIPFDGKHKATDYELRFDRMESPLCLETVPNGLVNGKCYYLGRNIDRISVDEALFANDSHCMVNLCSNTLGLYEKDTGRAVVCGISGFPYVLLWSKPGKPQFICIEPWHSLPSAENGSCRWEEKPAAARLAPGQSWHTTLTVRFIR